MDSGLETTGAKLGTGDVVDGKYELLGTIGQGGMSLVWLARDVRLNKLWAVKQIQRQVEDGNGDAVSQTLIAEAGLMKRFDHPALPRVVDIVERDDSIFVVMDYIEGESLAARMAKRGGSFDPDEVAGWGVQLCDALTYLHGLSPPVVYRDMKPGNVMVREDGSVKLVDFGIAREYKSGAESDTRIMGTRGYAAPEQLARGLQTDQRSDIYALGVTLHHLLTGVSPVADPSLKPVREIDPALPQGLERVIAKAVQVDPERRYQSCAQMRWDLEHHRELTDEHRAVLRRRVRIVYVLRVCACVTLAVGGVLAVLGVQGERSSFDRLMVRAALASTVSAGSAPSDAEELYCEAIDAHPARIEPYEALVNDVYRADARLTVAEYARLEELVDEHLSHIEGSPSFARLCYDIGVLTFVYFEQGGDGSVWGLEAAARSAPWFDRALQSRGQRLERKAACDLDERSARAARAYLVIGSFEQVVSQAMLEGGETQVYREFWDALEQVVLAFDDRDAPMVRLRVYALAAGTVSSPTYLTGVWRAGVERERVERIEEASFLGAEELAGEVAGQTLGERLCGQVRNEHGGALENIERVYGRPEPPEAFGRDAEGG